MSFGFHYRDEGAGRHRVPPLMSGNRGTDRHLIIRSVTNLPGFGADVVVVSYTCWRCGDFNEHPAQVADLSMVLARPEQTGGLLVFGDDYLHCGQPMQKAGSELRRLSVPLSTEDGAEDALASTSPPAFSDASAASRWSSQNDPPLAGANQDHTTQLQPPHQRKPRHE